MRDARRAKAKSTEDRPAVGKRVRYLRRVKRMTLNDLAHTAGCSVSLLSRVENDVVTPSLSTLHRLCHALDTSVSALLTEPDNQDAVVYGPSSRPTHARAEGVEGDGSSAESLVPFADTRLLEGLLINLPAGRKFCGPFEHHGEEVGYVLEGTLLVEQDGKAPVTLKAGGTFLIPAGTVHNATNTGTGTARVLATYIVDKGKPLATPAPAK